MSHRKIVFILMGISYFFLMAGNGLISLTHPDEVFYTQTAKEMMAQRSFATPYLFGQPQFEKPIFTYWLLMAVFKIFGVTAFWARFWPAFFGIVGVLATYGLAFLLFGSKRIGFLSGVILATNFIYLALSRAVLTDMIFSIWVVLSLVFFYYGYRNPGRKDIGIILCCVCSALAILTKGLLGFVFPAGAIALYLFYKKDRNYFNTRATLWGFCLFLIIAVPWHLVMIQKYGSTFINEYFKNVHMRRIFEAEHQKSNTWYFYLVTILGGIFPWSFFSIPAGYLSYGILKRSQPNKDEIVFLLLWIVTVVFIMQLAQSKLASYIFPVFPAIAILIGYYFDRVLSKENTFSMKVASYAMSFFMFAAALAAVIFAKRYHEWVADPKAFYVFLVVSIVCATPIFAFNKRAHYAAVIAFLPSMTVIVLLVAFLGHHYAEPWVSCRGICDAFKKIDNSPSRVLCSKFYARGVRFYTDREIAVIDNRGEGFFSPHPVPFLNSDGKILDFLNSQSTTYCIVKKGDVNEIRRIVKDQFSVTLLKEIGGKYLLIVKKI